MMRNHDKLLCDWCRKKVGRLEGMPVLIRGTQFWFCAASCAKRMEEFIAEPINGEGWE